MILRTMTQEFVENNNYSFFIPIYLFFLFSSDKKEKEA